jgi:hypothetical protein
MSCYLIGQSARDAILRRPSLGVLRLGFPGRDIGVAVILTIILPPPLPKKLTFTEPEKIRTRARRGESWGTSEARQMLEHGIETGRGGVFLRLTPEQYGKLGLTRAV